MRDKSSTSSWRRPHLLSQNGVVENEPAVVVQHHRLASAVAFASGRERGNLVRRVAEVGGSGGSGGNSAV